ncbi:TRAP transporter large permease [Nitratireductor luteus]|uniref:TRAP transporter large permease n=1 Tax=Nitratireductor luteus TaxID=2976980 RepID=UPI00223F2A26|nr:TRAP transporter large permease [Nitratireductor luteus]
MSVTVLFASFFVLLLLRVPIAMALGLSGFLVVFIEGLNPIVAISRLYEGLNSFPLLAVPFFLLAGQMMNAGEVTDRIMNFAMALVGHIKGGLAHVNVVVSMLFAGMSGSAVADTAGVGAILIPSMKSRGYSEPFVVALTAASSTMGAIIPPSILMVIYGAAGNVSIGALFLAGAIPGLLVGLVQMVYSFVHAVSYGSPAEPWKGAGEIGRTGRAAIGPLIVPAIILGGVLSGQFTATEAGMVATVYTAFLIFIVYRSFPIRSIPRLLSETVVNYSLPLLAVAAASFFGWLLAFLEVPDMAVHFAEPALGSPEATLIAIMALFLVLGTFLDAVPAIIIFMPIVSRLVEASGAHPVQTGIVVIMTLALGLVTPPYGLCLLVASMISKVSVVKVMPQMFIFLALMILVILAVIFVPALSLWLPKLLMPRFI